MFYFFSLCIRNGQIDDVFYERRRRSFLHPSSVMEVGSLSSVTLRDFSCEQSLLSRPDGSASFMQGRKKKIRKSVSRPVCLSQVTPPLCAVAFTHASYKHRNIQIDGVLLQRLIVEFRIKHKRQEGFFFVFVFADGVIVLRRCWF